MINKHRIIGTFLVFPLVLTAALVSAAQERGQYLPGFRGLNVAEQPGEGVTVGNVFTYYPANSIKDRNGDEFPIDADLDIIADTTLLAYTPKKKIFGATYSASIYIPFLNTAVTIPRFDDSISGGGIGDIYVEPISLGWAFKKGKARVAYGFTTPTGVDATTSDYWGHQLTAGGTYNPGKTGLWQVGVSSTWEFHHKKLNSDVKVGNNVTFEYGVGKTWVKNQGKQLLQFGIVGYSQFQITKDTGLDVTPFNAGAKDRVHAVGPEFDLILPPKKLAFFVRLLPEYRARSRTSGVTFMAGFSKTF